MTVVGVFNGLEVSAKSGVQPGGISAGFFYWWNWNIFETNLKLL